MLMIHADETKATRTRGCRQKRLEISNHQVRSIRTQLFLQPLDHRSSIPPDSPIRPERTAHLHLVIFIFEDQTRNLTDIRQTQLQRGVRRIACVNPHLMPESLQARSNEHRERRMPPAFTATTI